MTAKERVELELKELEYRTEKLDAFLVSDKIATLSNTMQALLFEQVICMLDYSTILKKRLALWDKA